MENYITQNKDVYENKYCNGYGIVYPESHIIRIYENILRYYLKYNPLGKSLLDFGCGTGAHSIYFKKKGFEVYGVDVSEEAIKICQRNLGDKLFKQVNINEEKVDIEQLFERKFDVIFANQVLYYLDEQELDYTLSAFDKALNKDGLVIFTMMSINNYYYKYSKVCEDKKNLRRVELKGRVEDTSYIQFINNEHHLKKLFNKFEELFIGKYDFELVEGSSEHYYFIGKKKELV